MYHRLGQVVVRYAAPILLGWLLVMALLWGTAPAWRSVIQDGEFAFLPDDAQTKQAADVYRRAFLWTESGASEDDENQRAGLNPLDSNIVIVVHRDDRPGGLAESRDFAFIDNEIIPRLKEIQATTGRGYDPLTPEQIAAPRPKLPASEQIITEILTRPPPREFQKRNESHVKGAMLASEDERASLVYIQLRTEMLDRSNNLVIGEVERQIVNNPELQRKRPLGLALDLSGTAVVGRDVLRAEQQSASRTEHLTQWLVVVLLLLIYRAPLLALIPLVTVGVSVKMTVWLLSLLAGWGWIGVFTGLEVYVTVVVYGAGVDYCLFLIARYREELDHGLTFPEAIQSAVKHVGAALATSAGTSIFGIGMMACADFGKFRQAGIAISLGLTIVLLLSLSLTPAMLRLCGKWAFWPDLRSERLDAGAGWLPTLSFTRFLNEQAWLERGWQKVADVLLARPATVFATTVMVLTPLALVGFACQGHLNYGLLTDLPPNDPSVQGAKAVQRHFPPGVSGQTVVLLKHPKFDLSLGHGQVVSGAIVDRLRPQLDQLELADIRCQGYPLGLTRIAQRLNAMIDRGPLRRVFALRVLQMYASTEGPLAGQVMRLDLIFRQDPFLRESIGDLKRIEAAVLAAVPDEYRDGVQLYTLGPTASLRDLKQVTDSDRVLIDVLVVVVVYVLLISLLRRPAICAYLLVTVVFSFLVTMGATYVVFRIRQGDAFAGLDWKIPLFLFTILIAIGEDYNILLMARVTEEQQKHGLIRGVLVALTKTGSIISSCGVIMAGTFASLMTGTLLGMVEMGFALAFGVLLDTFVVRPVLVPSYLLLLYSGRFGRFGRWLGAPSSAAAVPLTHDAVAAEAAGDERRVEHSRRGEFVEN